MELPHRLDENDSLKQAQSPSSAVSEADSAANTGQATVHVVAEVVERINGQADSAGFLGLPDTSRRE